MSGPDPQGVNFSQGSLQIRGQGTPSKQFPWNCGSVELQGLSGYITHPRWTQSTCLGALLLTRVPQSWQHIKAAAQEGWVLRGLPATS